MIDRCKCSQVIANKTEIKMSIKLNKRMEKVLKEDNRLESAMKGIYLSFLRSNKVEEIVGDARLDSTRTCTDVRTLDAEELGPRIAPVEVLLSAVEEAQESVESYCH